MRTLSSKLTGWYIAAFSVLLLASFSAIYFGVNSVFNYRIKEDLFEDIEEYRSYFQEGGIEKVKNEILREVQYEDVYTEYILLYDSDNNLVFNSNISAFIDLPTKISIHQDLKEEGPVFRTRMQTFIEDHEAEEEKFSEALGSMGNGFVLTIGESMDEKNEIMEILLYSFIAVLFLVLPLCGVSGWVVAKRAMSGVNRVSLVASRINRGELDERVSVTSTDQEIVELSNTFNSMLDRIKSLVTEMREMIDNVAHDLKSPLARIRIISEDLIGDSKTPDLFKTAAIDTINECDRLLRMINESLDVAEAEVGIGIRSRESVDLTALVGDAVELFQPVAEQKNIKLESGVMPNCRISAVEQVVQRAVANLIDNAIKYTDQGGTVKLELEIENDEVRIIVADTGIGISTNEQSKVFTRFYRCDNSRGKDGCGLGLNYSRAVARALGGDILLKSKLNEGSVFTIKLPATHLA